jgi:predicted  nucleic acid-binding Zn-ribbon protein
MLLLTKNLQRNLLEVAKLDLEISRVDARLRDLQVSSEIDALRSSMIAIGDELLSAHARVTNLEQQLNKTLDDVSLVSARIKHDESRAMELSSDRDLKAINHELDSLRHRMSTLEDAELEIMDEIEKAKDQADALTAARTRAALDLEQALKAHDATALEVSKTRGDLQATRARIAGTLPADAIAAYDRKAARGIAVGELDGRDCTACRFAVNGVAYDSLMSEPVDMLVTCPNCNAYLVR